MTIEQTLSCGSRFLRRAGFTLLGLLALTRAGYGASTTLAWDANTESNLAGYRLHYGTAQGNYTTTLDVGKTTSAMLSSLTSGQAYYAVVTAYNTSQLESLASNEVSFTPSASAATNVGLWPASATPTVADGGPDNPVEVGVKFSSDVPGTITGVRFYKAQTNTGAHVANLWSSSGALLANAQFTNETASGWQQANFATPVGISANTVYVASYHTMSGHYGADTKFFATKGVDNPPLHAPLGSNGVYAYGSGSIFPNQSWNSCNYWVDVAFSSAQGTAPVLVTTALPAGAVNVAYSGTLVASGGTPPYSWSVTTGTLPNGLNLNSSLGVISGTPTLAGTATFTAAVTDSGNRTSTKSLNIAILPVKSFWSGATIPAVVDGGSDNPVELGLRFRSDVAGTITGIRFYKALTNTGTHVANLWTSTGSRLATATFANETASGWQQVYFATPVAIAANTVYVASYHALNGHYSADAKFFAATGVDNTPLHAPSVSNGTYAYGTGSVFPAQVWNACNYWVDVMFLPKP